MTREELIEYCLTYPDAVEDYPFKDRKNTIIRHGSSSRGEGKWFALIFELENRLCINLKCDPTKSDFLRSVYKEVIPAWHMNKAHWNTIILNGNVPKEELYDMISGSYKLTKDKKGNEGEK